MLVLVLAAVLAGAGGVEEKTQESRARRTRELLETRLREKVVIHEIKCLIEGHDPYNPLTRVSKDRELLQGTLNRITDYLTGDREARTESNRTQIINDLKESYPDGYAERFIEHEPLSRQRYELLVGKYAQVRTENGATAVMQLSSLIEGRDPHASGRNAPKLPKKLRIPQELRSAILWYVLGVERSDEIRARIIQDLEKISPVYVDRFKIHEPVARQKYLAWKPIRINAFPTAEDTE